jgi:hypothetical protein
MVECMQREGAFLGSKVLARDRGWQKLVDAALNLIQL